MEVVAATPGGGGVPPFHDHDVREWSRIDSLTGVLERARLETDHWTANTNNSCHKYGKVVDSRARTNADGALQQKARRQLEVYQSQIPGGHLQVIKTHTVSSSRWSNKSSTANIQPISRDFENLQLTLNPLDLSSQKSKATVGRSVGRRPPSRPRARDESSTDSHLGNPLRNAQQKAATSLRRVSRLCNQIHENTVKQTLGEYLPKPSINERQSADGIEVVEIESVTSASDNERTFNNGHPGLSRTKSTSSEDLHLLTPEKDKSTKSTEDLEDLEQLQSWRRTSKLRRSLQYPKPATRANTTSKPLDLPENNGSVRKIREELEKGRRLSTALRGNNVDLEALDQILQSISSSSSIHSDKTSTIDDNQEELDKEIQSLTKAQKRNSFVTVETLQEVRGRLRRTSSPTTEDLYKSGKEEETDDGITEDINSKELNVMPASEKSSPKSRVRSYVYGMEAMLNKKPILGTGSLESRSKVLNGNAHIRNEDWYNRRKSYGFEQVHSHNETSTPICLKNKNRVESSTDSGICRSSEIVIVPTATKTNKFTENYICDTNPPDYEINKKFNNVKHISSIFDQGHGLNKKKPPNEFTYAWDKQFSQKDADYKSKNDFKSTTITIPIVSKTTNSNFIDVSWDDKPEKEIKRHSIAVDESKYVTSNNEHRFRRTSLAINDKFYPSDALDDALSQSRKLKKVEFCKTEVHFAAESGKVNIVETDEKPPPTNNFRRRRRNSGPISDIIDYERNGLPILHFGDSSYEKSLLGVRGDDCDEDKYNEEDIYQNVPVNTPITCGTVTVSTISNQFDVQEGERKDLLESDSIKGILKNKPIKPTSYHLGENELSFLNYSSDSDSGKWGVKLKPIPKSDPPIWKSTVTLHNTVYGKENENADCSQPEFQKLLKTLRPTSVNNKPDLISRNTENFSGVKFVTSTDTKRPWFVADRIKLSEDTQWAENKVYSTKVNFGDGGTTVIENDSFKNKEQNSRWESPTKDNSSENAKPIQMFGIGHSPSNLMTVKQEETSSKDLSQRPYKANSKDMQFSPVALRKASSLTKRSDLKTVPLSEKLSSPSLVGRNSKIELQSDHFDYNEKSRLEFANDAKLQQKYAKNDIVLRQPRKSEMTYFGVNLSPKPVKKIQETVIQKDDKLFDKPDLLQHMKTEGPKSTANLIKPRRSSPEDRSGRNKSPIYENVSATKHSTTKSKYSREFDNSIIEELTKAADQILQAVNGFTDDDSQNRLSDDDHCKKEPLETISETKSWNFDRKTKTTNKQIHSNAILKHTSSTSSVESVSKDSKRTTPPTRRAIQSKPIPERLKKKSTSSDSNTTKATTKARRLQRASSREALLQSRGSSSEDLGANIETPQRKPRQIKKTKAVQLTITNGLEINKKTTPPNPTRRKKSEEIRSKTEERTVEAVPEIRHKTAVSTIRSTVEKSSRDRSKSRSDDAKRKITYQKRESSRGVNPSSKSDPKRNVSSKETVNHRISTANIKKCSRADGGSRH